MKLEVLIYSTLNMYISFTLAISFLTTLSVVPDF